MLDIQGFIKIGPLQNNTPNALSPVGELSYQSGSFARDKQLFSKQGQQVELVAFTSKRDDVTVTVPAAFSNKILDITQWIYIQSIAGAFKNDEVEFQRLLVGNFSADMSKVSTGAMISTNGNWFPRWVAWTLEGQEDNEIRVWFSDADFDQQYLGYEIIMVPMIEPIDTFQSVKTVVELALEGWTLPLHHDKVNERAGNVPYTAILSHRYTWHDREDPESTMLVNFSAIIYGRAGLNPSYIKKAYRDQILANSQYPVRDWIPVFPEIFTSTQFTFIPGWNIYGVPNMEDIASLYSPALPYEFEIAAISDFGEWLATGTKVGNITIPKPKTAAAFFPSRYKSLSSICIAGDENALDKQTVWDVLKGYSLTSTTSSDMGGVPKDTTEWMRLFLLAIIAAEEYHPYGQSIEIVKLTDANNPDHTFYVFEHKNIEYRVLTRTSKWSWNSGDEDLNGFKE